jgi:hypothetical protein
LLQIALSEQPQHVANQQDHKHCAEPYARASASTPPVVAVISTAPTENQQQNDNENDQHFASPLLRASRVMTLVGLRRVSSKLRFTEERAV